MYKIFDATQTTSSEQQKSISIITSADNYLYDSSIVNNLNTFNYETTVITRKPEPNEFLVTQRILQTQFIKNVVTQVFVNIEKELTVSPRGDFLIYENGHITSLNVNQYIFSDVACKLRAFLNSKNFFEDETKPYANHFEFVFKSKQVGEANICSINYNIQNATYLLKIDRNGSIQYQIRLHHKMPDGAILKVLENISPESIPDPIVLKFHHETLMPQLQKLLQKPVVSQNLHTI